MPEVCTIVPEDGWAICPRCHKGKLVKTRPDTEIRNLPCKCKRCGYDPIVNIEKSLSP